MLRNSPNHDINLPLYKVQKDELTQKLCLFFYDPKDLRKEVNLDNLPIDQIEALLAAGADPNYEFDGSHFLLGYKNLLRVAISNRHLPLIEILIKYGADVNQIYRTKQWKNLSQFTAEEQFEYDAKNRNTTLQDTIHDYYSALRYSRDPRQCDTIIKIYQLLEKHFKVPEKYQIQDYVLHHIYGKLHQLIKQEKINAEANKQPLLIVLGEFHDSVTSLLIEIMTLLIAKQFGIHLLFTETTASLLNLKKNCEPVPCVMNDWETSNSFIPYAVSLGYSVLPVDLGKDGAKKIGPQYNDYEEYSIEEHLGDSFDNTSEKGMKYRDEVMHNIIINSVPKDAILIVGASHLYGLAQKEYPHHVIFVNASKMLPKELACLEKDMVEERNEYYKDSMRFLLTSDIVRDIAETSMNAVEWLWYAEKVLNVATHIHANYDPASHHTVMPSQVGLFRRPPTAKTPTFKYKQEVEKNLELPSCRII